MQITNANFLVEDEWKDLYDFEKPLVRSIPRIVKPRRQREPLEVTRNQVQRIGQGLESAARRVEHYGRAADAAAHAVAGGFWQQNREEKRQERG
ncbi:MAG TPA: hypothetical protein VME43_04605 [Bryobacteraceae bacterium]|nr:hypothetical protein [Bryobacteraceae bacterium]